MKQTKQCPKCKSYEVYTDANKTMKGQRSYSNISTFTTFRVDLYLCLSCGYVEEYMSNRNLNDQSKIEKIRKHYQKV